MSNDPVSDYLEAYREMAEARRKAMVLIDVINDATERINAVLDDLSDGKLCSFHDPYPGCSLKSDASFAPDFLDLANEL